MTPYEGPLDLDRMRSFFQTMRAGRERGSVEVWTSDAKRIFWFDVDSVRVSTLGSRRSPNLGELLVLHNRITPEQHKLCLENQKRLRIRYNEVISVMGILPAEEVKSELLEQLQQELCESFTWPGTRMKLHSQYPDSEMMKTSFGAMGYVLDALDLAHELCRRIDEWKRVNQAIPSFHEFVRITPEGRKLFGTMRREDPLRPMLQQIDGKKSVDAVVDSCPLPRFEAYRAIYLLFTQGYLEIDGARRADLSGVQATVPVPLESPPSSPVPSQPEAEPAPEGPRPAAPPAGETSTPPGASGARKAAIVVIEDLAHIRRIISYELDRAGYQVYEASGGRDGLQLLENLHVDLVLLDVMMPEMDGLQVCRELRRRAELAALPVLMITAKTRSDAVAQILSAGATDYLFKPYKREQLLEKVGKLLKR